MEKLEDDLRALRSDVQKSTLDWLDVYGKAKKLFGRVAKAQARAEAEEEAGETGLPPANQYVGTLSPRARLIQNQILARRRSNGGPDGVLPDR